MAVTTTPTTHLPHEPCYHMKIGSTRSLELFIVLVVTALTTSTIMAVAVGSDPILQKKTGVVITCNRDNPPKFAQNCRFGQALIYCFLGSGHVFGIGKLLVSFG
ncbi:hypothetical protein F4810DRAFT_657196 [Camillea tinctor]|nr:hypothetical protein F4810DRAFT_657196 [Camillea tinctor]